MKLVILIMTICFVQVSAASRAQNLTFIKKGTTLDQIFKEIKIQTGYNVVYFKDQFKGHPKIDVNFQHAELKTVLQYLSEKNEFEFLFDERNISIKKKPSIIERIVDYFVNIDVRGKVLDEKGEPLVGATVAVKGKNMSVKTDQNGAFFLDNVGESDKLVISFIGYQDREVDAASDMGSLTMVVADAELEEVKINAGYYSVTDRERTGSISRITSKDIEKQPVNNVLMALQSRVTGLEIIQQTGLPGGSFTVRVRGQNSLRSGNDPLYIINGVPFPSTGISGERTSNILGTSGANPLSLINPNDIESIEVLKDADATAIYGSRGANGVILITTKKNVDEKSNVNVSLSKGVSQVGHRIKLLNTSQYLTMRKEALSNDGLQAGNTDYDVNGTWDEKKSTDWQDLLIGGNAPINSAATSVSGGTVKSSYLVSGNYYDEGTVLPGNLGFSRVNINSNINFRGLDGRLNTTFNSSFNNTNSKLSSNVIGSIFLPPNQPDPFDEFGQLNWANNTVTSNPFASLLQTNNAKSNTIIGNVIINYKIIKDLAVNISVGYTNITRDEFQKTPLAYYAPSYNFPSSFRESLFGNNSTVNMIAEPQIAYSLNTGFGKFNALVGTSIQDSKSHLNVISATNFNSDDLMENMGSAATLQTSQDVYSHYNYIAAFGRINYNFQDKFLLNVTARRDGSTRFGPDNRFANFGAIGAAWIFTEETFLKNQMPFLSFGKLRSSYGITGNDQISDYAYLQLWNPNAVYEGNTTLSPGNNAPNTNFAWESNRKFEAAIELGFINGKISTNVAYYQNRSTNLLLYSLLPLSTGLGGTYQNLPAKVQNAGWEFDVDLKLFKQKSFDWSAKLNLSVPRNELLSYPGLETSSDFMNYAIGKPLSIRKVYNVSVNPTNGLYEFEDKNGNGARDDGDRQYSKFLGQKFYGGIQNSVQYRQFNVDFAFSFAKQNGKSYRTSGNFSPGLWFSGATSNQFIEVEKRWRNVGEQTSVQKYSTDFGNYFLNDDVKTYGDLSVVDASYIRLRNISLSYSIGERLLNTFKIKKASVNIQAQNVFTITNYVGLDPESQVERLPPLRTFIIGLNINF